MANAYSTNYTLANSGEITSATWKLLRTLIAAGWQWKASGNGQSSGVYNAAQTGSSAATSTLASNVLTLTGLTGMSPGVIGQWITISGSSHSTNNGTFLIVSYTSSSSVSIYNASGVASDSGPLTWTLIRDSALDSLAEQGHVNLTNVPSGGSGSGTGVSIAASNSSTGSVTITGVTGFSLTASPNRVVTITGSTAGNNGNYRIINATAAGTSVGIYAPGLLAETSNASLTITEQYGGTGASITTWTTTTSGQSTLINVTGLSGLSSADINRKIKFVNPTNSANIGSFTIVGVNSSSSCTIYSPFATQNDYGVGGTSGTPTLQWVEWDPLQQTYPSYIQASNGVGCWANLQGPTIMKIPVGTNVATGNFIRGENVTQSSTGAQGELLGYMPDSSGGTGFMVIAPRVIGTGTNAGPATLNNMTYGWNNVTTGGNTDTITGGISGATITSTNNYSSNGAIPIAYVREIVWWKGSTTQGHIYYQCLDQNPSGTETPITSTTGRFSLMANTLSQVSSVIPPAGSTGGSCSTNGFPTTAQGSGSYIGTFVMLGTGGAGSGSTNSFYWLGQPSTSPGKAQILCTNNIEQQLVSADGSWTYAQSCNTSGFQASGFYRCDNQEDGDLDPYVCLLMNGNSDNGTPSRYQITSSPYFQNSDAMNWSNSNPSWYVGGTGITTNFRGFRRRGLNVTGTNNTLEYLCNFDHGVINSSSANAYNALITLNSSTPDLIATAPSGTTIYTRDPIWVALPGNSGQNNGVRMRKGTPRWLFVTQGVSVLSTFDNKQWLVLSSTNAPICVGPYDGATSPSF